MQSQLQPQSSKPCVTEWRADTYAAKKRNGFISSARKPLFSQSVEVAQDTFASNSFTQGRAF